MMNLSSLSKALWISVALLLIQLGNIIYYLLFNPRNLSFTCLFTMSMAGLVVVLLYKAEKHINKIIPLLEKWKQGDLEERIVKIEEKGNLGNLSWLCNDIIDVLDAFLRESCASMEAIENGQYYRQIILTGLIGQFKKGGRLINETIRTAQSKNNFLIQASEEFRKNIKTVVNNVQEASASVQRHCASLTTMSETSLAKNSAVVKEVESVRANVSYVATTTSELHESINKIRSQVEEAKIVADEASHEAESATQTINNLKEASLEINNIIKLISDIAGQTNLLALNATIEAARSGQAAGKGFAVVASEVKNLARETVMATDKIVNQVQNIQSFIQGTVTAIETISGTINRISEISTAVSSAVESQHSSTQQISNNMNEAAISTQSVSGNIEDVKEIAEETYTSVKTAVNSANELAKEIKDLSDEISFFTTNINSSTNRSINHS
ncbi:methyl-accepting chemotaxis protein [Candidatus Odyssella thessalonicensis]|uniref:methyl-accepting chemotaxis protein n=1 Tax=Candidatus Odyssella thessalonicensis TaxID=84647 RepID=UPI00049744CC|nr:methyl-accepting chemotaxis protein [Candidatus Odyssella thessalonicensis]